MHKHRLHRLLTVATLLLTASGLMLAGFGCKTVSQEALQRSRPVTLKFWSVFDDGDAIQKLTAAYQAMHPNVFVEFRRLRYDEYEKELTNALAQDKGPDILSLQNTWLTRWQPRIQPAPYVLNLAFRELQGSIKKDYVWVMRKVPGISIKQLQNDYVDGVAADVVLPVEQADPSLPMIDRIFGLPLSMDTMVMYYNRDMLNNAGIAQPAVQWQEFQDHVKRITKLDEVGTIIRAGAAIGTAGNVERAADILAVLMMQNGAQMIDPVSGVAAFDRYPAEMAGRALPPGGEALVFYTDFANPEKEVYTWNDKMPNSLEAFVQGQAAYFFGYAYHLPTIRQMNPKLNFGIANFPQIQGNKPVYYANYWVESVSKKTKYPNEAWDYVTFITQAQQAQQYLAAAKLPTALRSLVNAQLDDLDLSVFASQVLSAKNWYHGNDSAAVESVFDDMITQQLSGQADTKRIVELGAIKVNQTIK